jgi:hypothetical protein
MDKGPGWLPDPEREGQERYWNGSDWTDRVRPAGKARSLHLPEHVPDLQRALAAATADIDAVEDRLSTLFDRGEGVQQPTSPATRTPPASPPGAEDDEIPGLYDEDEDEDVDGVDEDPIHEEFAGVTEQGGGDLEAEGDDDGAFTELDAALAAEEPEPVEPEGKRGFFRRRS